MSIETPKADEVPCARTATDILALRVTAVPTIIEGLLPKKGLAALSGGSDGGKSFLALFIAMFICGTEMEIFGLRINRTCAASRNDKKNKQDFLLKSFAAEGFPVLTLFRELDST